MTKQQNRHANAAWISEKVGLQWSSEGEINNVEPFTTVLHDALTAYKKLDGPDRGKKTAAWAAVILRFGGGGENRTRVRKTSTVGTTCLVASFGSRLPDAGGQAAGKPVTLL